MQLLESFFSFSNEIDKKEQIQNFFFTYILIIVLLFFILFYFVLILFLVLH